MEMQENIIIFFDQSSEINFMKIEPDSPSAFDRFKNVALIFMNAKKSMAGDRPIQFCLLIEDENSFVKSTSKKSMISFDTCFEHLKKLPIDNGDKYGSDDVTPLDLEKIILKAAELANLNKNDKDVNPIVHLVVFLCRSSSEINIQYTQESENVLKNPNFYIDVLYVHEEQTPDNQVQKILATLHHLQVRKENFIFHCNPDVKVWHKTMARLLKHPRLRLDGDQVTQEKPVANSYTMLKQDFVSPGSPAHEAVINRLMQNNVKDFSNARIKK